uniref:Peptidase S41 n=1 Tax=Syphacia muris TaxID=451379 RepID=A0A0N5AW63_9BILA
MSGRLFAAILITITTFDYLYAFPQQVSPQSLKNPVKRFYSWEEAKRSAINSAIKSKYYPELDYLFLSNRFAFPNAPDDSRRFNTWME